MKWKNFFPNQHNIISPFLVGANQPGVGKAEFMNERDILYKLFFDLKKDVTEMKKMFFEMVQNPSMASSVFSNGGRQLQTGNSFFRKTNAR